MVGSIRSTLAISMVILATLLMTPLQMLAMKSRLIDSGRLPRLWHALMLKALGLRVHVRGAIATERPLLIASNHISWTDVMVLGSLAEVTFIAKSELAGWPIFGFLSRLQRTLFVERGERRKAGEQAGALAGRLAGNDAVVLFAEGSTGDGNQLLPFKSALFGAAGLALAGGASPVYIQPVAIAYTRLHGMPMGRQHRPLACWIGASDLLPHLMALVREGAMDVDVEFGTAFEFTAMSDRKTVARQVELRVSEMMAAALRGRHMAG